MLFSHSIYNCDNRYIQSSEIIEHRDSIYGVYRNYRGMTKLTPHEIRVWLNEKLIERGSKAKLAKHLGLTPTQVTRMASLKAGVETRDVSPTELQQIVDYFGDAPTGYAQPQAEASPFHPNFALAAVIGTVEAGSFREIADMDQSELERISVPADPQFPNARLLAFNVAGTSMNDLTPMPILPGSLVVGISYEDISQQFPLRDGLVVVVERTRDGGHLREWSVKQIEIFEERVEFHPRSKDRSHKPIVVQRNHDVDDGTSVQIIAIVRRVINDISF